MIIIVEELIACRNIRFEVNILWLNIYLADFLFLNIAYIAVFYVDGKYRIFGYNSIFSLWYCDLSLKESINTRTNEQ